MIDAGVSRGVHMSLSAVQEGCDVSAPVFVNNVSLASRVLVAAWPTRHHSHKYRVLQSAVKIHFLVTAVVTIRPTAPNPFAK
jgi:hypothetical protein